MNKYLAKIETDVVEERTSPSYFPLYPNFST